MLNWSEIEPLRQQLQQWRGQRQRIALVPTMGNLHEGHLQLVERAQQLARRVVVSIFVNPLQFGAGEDLDRYPRTLAADSRALEELGVDLLFAPTEAVIYPHGRDTTTQVEVPHLSDLLCGASRPGHFRGVATVVAKLFHLIQPDVALFGEKDWQQLTVIRRMVADLNFPVEIVSLPTVRDLDGLALSSRNGYLTAAERQQAPALYAMLTTLAARLSAGDDRLLALEQEGITLLQRTGFTPDYVAIRRPSDLMLHRTTSLSSLK